MQSDSHANRLADELAHRSGERRKNARFDMHFRIFLRAFGDPWTVTETADVSATGAFLVTDRPFQLETPIEYVLTFPADLTKALRALRVRFFGTVLRCERGPEGQSKFGVAVRNTAHRYLTPEEAAGFDAIEQNLPPVTYAAATSQSEQPE